jgi:deoxyribodipyrimidine photo-lyase
VKVYGENHGLVRELLWREFYANVTNHIPHILVGQVSSEPTHPMKLKFDNVEWPHDEKKFKRWCEGKTGFPFVDAAMICMNKTGYMHNRLRMIVAMFLTKDMAIDWRMGERYFAQKLIDYDPSSNSGGWQWAGSIGADSQPYFRIFNPWTQSEKFDKDAAFIKKWIPLLANVPAKSIHNWDKDHVKYNNKGYPAPMLDHSIESKKALGYFQ